MTSLDDVYKQIAEFEKKFRGSFYTLFSNMTEQEMDAHPEAVDIHDWRELEKEKLLGRLRDER